MHVSELIRSLGLTRPRRGDGKVAHGHRTIDATTHGHVARRHVGVTSNARARIRALQDSGALKRYSELHPAEFYRLLYAAFPPMAGGDLNAGGGAQPQVQAAIPFTSAAHEHGEPAFVVSANLATTATTLGTGPLNIPAFGYLRHIFLEVVVSGGTGGTIAADGPWNIIQSINFQDVNGANIVGPFGGYELYVANLIGGYAPRSNPVDCPWFVGTAPNPAFYLRVPAELNHTNGLGSLGNQNSSANFQLSVTLNTIANAYSVAPTGTLTVTVRGWLEAWTLPAPVNGRQMPQMQVPPLLGTGQYWTARAQATLVGQNTVGLTRLGNYIRALVFVARDNSAVRSDAVFPDPLIFNWDGVQQWNVSQRFLQQYWYEKTNGTLTRPAGVFALLYNTGGPSDDVGNEDPTLWLPTTTASRLEVTGNSASAGSIQVLTNEVAPVDPDQATRYQFPSGSGAIGANLPPTTVTT